MVNVVTVGRCGDALDLRIDSHLVEESHDLGLQLLRVLAELQHAEEPSIVSRWYSPCLLCLYLLCLYLLCLQHTEDSQRAGGPDAALAQDGGEEQLQPTVMHHPPGWGWGQG